MYKYSCFLKILENFESKYEWWNWPINRLDWIWWLLLLIFFCNFLKYVQEYNFRAKNYVNLDEIDMSSFMMNIIIFCIEFISLEKNFPSENLTPKIMNKFWCIKTCLLSIFIRIKKKSIICDWWNWIDANNGCCGYRSNEMFSLTFLFFSLFCRCSNQTFFPWKYFQFQSMWVSHIISVHVIHGKTIMLLSSLLCHSLVNSGWWWWVALGNPSNWMEIRT